MEKSNKLNFSNIKEIIAVGKALSSETRIQVLKLLLKEQLNVNEIAEKLNIPASSAAMHVKVLEEAKLIRTELKPGVRGSMKVCIKQIDEILFQLWQEEKENEEVINMPIGNFVDYEVYPTCGIVSEKGHIDAEDEPRCFYNPNRTKAKLLWFGRGYVEYRFSNARVQNENLKSVEISVELCSEIADYDLGCASDITFWINGIDAGTWNCPSDFGGRRGKLNPDWWPDKNTQYGNLKVWKINNTGTYINQEKVSDVPLKNYNITANPYISVKIGMKENAENMGGINIFGDSFGDYPQNILMKFRY
jgi:Predicted transcriptional regulator